MPYSRSRPSSVASTCWVRWLALCLLATTWGWSEATVNAKGPYDVNPKIGDTVVFTCDIPLDNGGDSCTWYRNSVEVTAGMGRSGTIWTLTFIVLPADANAQYYCIIKGMLKEHTHGDVQSRVATLTIQAANTPFKILSPVVGGRLTADTTTNPPGILFNASQAVQTWEYNFPNTDAVFHPFTSTIPNAMNAVCPLTVLPAVDVPFKIRITSPANEVFIGDYTMAGQPLTPVNLATATFSSPFYFAMCGVPFSVDQQHGLERFNRDPNDDQITYTKVSGTNLTINANGSFTWTPPALPSGTTFPGTNVLNQQVTAGTYSMSDGSGSTVGPFDIKVTVYANPGDLNRDGVVNIQDVQLVLSKFGQNPGVPTDL